nr:hypothetical protein [Tanacetum cinerariifolium]
MSTQQDINAIRAKGLVNIHDPLPLIVNTLTPFHPDQSSHITYLQHPQPNNNFVQQPSFRTNYMPQPMQNLKDNSDPTTAMNKALALIAKAFKLNTIPTNNNQRSSLIPRNSQIAQPDINTSQDIKMKMVDDNVGNHVKQNAIQNDRNKYGNRNTVTAPAEGNGNVIIGNSIRCYNCRGEGHYASNCTVKIRKRDAAYHQQQLQIAQEEEAGIQSTREEFEFMATTDSYEETERSDKAPVYDSDGSAKTTNKNLFDSIKVTQAQNNSIINSLQKQLYDTIYENAKLRAQLFDKAFKQKGISKVTRTNTKFTKQSILGKPPSSSFKPKLYSVTPFPKSLVLPKVDKKNDLFKLVTSNSAPSTQELKDVQTVNVIALESLGLILLRPLGVNNTAKTRRLHHRSNFNIDRVPSKSKSSCLSNNVEKIEENHRNS